VSGVLGLLLIASGAQGGTAHPREALAHTETLALALLIAALSLGGVLIFMHLRRRARRQPPVTDEWQALAVMGELCPHGWEANITLHGWGAPVPDDAPAARVPLVELEWKQFDEEYGQVAVVRRVWAPSIGEALQAMVEDRRTDFALEEIERAGREEGDLWWSD
jgi:hypothetical protein